MLKEALVQTNRALDAQKEKRTAINLHIDTLQKQVRCLIHQLADEPVFVFEYENETYICNNGAIQKVRRI